MEKQLSPLEALDILSAIPEHKFIVGQFYDASCDKACSVGWLWLKTSGFYTFSDSTLRLSRLSYQIFNKSISDINDASSEDFPEATPKQRVIHLLKSLQNAGY